MIRMAHTVPYDRRYTVLMTTTTHRTPPAPIRAHLHRSYTTAHHADARIVQAFDAKLGWYDVTSAPFPSPAAIRTLRQRGATHIGVAYNRPRGGRPVADFSIAECLR